LEEPEYTVIGPALEEEGAEVHRAYFKKE